MSHDGHDHEDHSHHHGHDAVPREHKSHAPAQVAVFAITCSDSRGAQDDPSGELLREKLQAAGHTVVGSAIVKDDAIELREAIERALAAGARAVLVTGGTGISPRDVTVETVRALFEKELPGFGELFRALSFREIGSSAMLSRAVAGTFRGAILFAMPGSPHAVKLALEALILPELGHAVRELSR